MGANSGVWLARRVCEVAFLALVPVASSHAQQIASTDLAHQRVTSSRAEFTCKIGERRERQRRIGYEDSQKDYGGDSIRDVARDCAGERVFRGTLSGARCVLSQNGSHRSVPYSRSK